MSLDQADGDHDRRGGLGRALRLLVPLAILAVAAVLVWRLANDRSGVRREAPEVPVLALTPPPPPPPPPPPKETPPTPEKTVETPNPTPAPKTDSPQKSDSAPKQLTINGPPQGADNFGVAAGAGGGVSVGGDPNGSDTGGGGDFGAASYGRYLTGVLQRTAQADPQISRDVFSTQVEVWIAPDGTITRVALVKSSGDERKDQALLAMVRALRRLDEPPPAQLKFPALIALHGRRA